MIDFNESVPFSDNSIFVSNYKIGVELFVYLKNFTQNSKFKNNEVYIFEKDRYIKYTNDYNQKIYYSTINPNLDENKILNEVKEPSLKKNIKKTNSLKELKKASLNYKYILVDKDLQSIFEDDFGYIECLNYSESKEGKRWFYIHGIRYQMSELEKLRSLAIFKKNNEYNKEFFTYIETNFDQKTAQELYQKFFNELPILCIPELNQIFYDAIYVNVHIKEKMMFDKSIINYLDENSKQESVYIGKQEDPFISNQIIYNPQFYGAQFYAHSEFFSPTIEVIHESFFETVAEVKEKKINKFTAKLDDTIENKSMQNIIFSKNDKLDSIDLNDKYFVTFKFEDKKNNFTINCDDYYDLINLYNNDLKKLYETHFHLYSNEGNFYKNYRKFLNELLYKICIQKEVVDFENQFKIDIEFFKLLSKTNKILDAFDQFLAKKHIKNIKKNVFLNKIRWDFYSLESNIAIDIATSKDNLDKYHFKKNWCLAKEYYVITEEKDLLILNV